MNSTNLVLDWRDHPQGGADPIAQRVCGPFRMRFLSKDRTLSLFSYEMGRCRLNRVIGAPSLVTHRGPNPRDANNTIKIMLPLGPVRIRQGDVTTLLEPCALMVVAPPEGHMVSSPASTDQIIAHIPSHVLLPRFSRLLRRPVVFRPSEAGMPRILSSFLISTFRELDSLNETGRACVGGSIVQMVTDLLTMRENEAERGYGLDTLLTRAKAFVISNASDPTLRISTVARHMGCSERYLFKAFEKEPLTLERLILNTRLDRARAQLLVAGNQISIRSIAEGAGFSAYAHFSRAFKTRFGISPSVCVAFSR